MLTNEEIAELETTLKRLAEIEGRRLIRRREWGEINFLEIKPEIDSSIDLARELLELPLSFIPKKEFDEIRQIVPQLVERLASINRFSLKLANPAQSHNDICRNLRDDSNLLASIALPIIPYLRMKQGGVKELTEQLQKTIAETERFFQEARKRNEEFMTKVESQMEEQQQRTSKVLSNAEAASARAGVAKFTEVFASEAKKQSWKSWAWLLVTAGLGTATLYVASSFYFNPLQLDNPDSWELVAHVGSRGAILAILITGAVWCGRVYRALLHQAAINKHRALSLRTFRAFVEATKSSEVKDAILLAAANASFGNTTTGLVDQKGSEGFAVGLYEAVQNLKRDE